MTLLRRSAASLAAELTAGRSVLEHMLEQMLYASGHRPSTAEIHSWERSLPVLAADVVDAGLGAVEVLVEYHLPLTSQRADVVLAGAHPETKAPSYVVVELKQWSEAHRFGGDPNLVDVPGAPGPPRLHPVKQVRGYCEYLMDFARVLEDQPDAVAGAAYLHNAVNREAVEDLFDFPMDTRGRLFTGADRARFQEFLRGRLAADVPGAPYADVLLGSRVAPSVQLLKVAADEIKHREQFTLLGEQALAVDLVMHHVRAARRADHKRAVIVTGGPGSGKSVIALSLLGELARDGRAVLHATGSRSFTQTLRRVAGRRDRRVQSLFKYFNQFMTAERNSLDVLVLDEAHRIRETSVDRYTRAEFRTGRPQVNELIAAARVPVFLLDENQIVRPGDSAPSRRSRRPAGRCTSTSTSSTSAVSSGAAGARRTSAGCNACWAWPTASPNPGRATPSSPSSSLTAPSRWSRSSAANTRKATARGWRPATAGRGVTRVRTARSCRTSGSAPGRGRGTSRKPARGDGAAGRPVVHRGGRLRPGRLRLHGARLRI